MLKIPKFLLTFDSYGGISNKLDQENQFSCFLYILIFHVSRKMGRFGLIHDVVKYEKKMHKN